eukprot:TRINITY_DN10046_c0_g1_i1.p2 TRINITY_DN10046_c0_g1~~TRINITY_DN10046_c0_g1_i1.p2  ORF type:complete len:114 (+),score=46.21 TRINITY_DN10046_c0_g1_i1:503-844(+)
MLSAAVFGGAFAAALLNTKTDSAQGGNYSGSGALVLTIGNSGSVNAAPAAEQLQQQQLSLAVAAAAVAVALAEWQHHWLIDSYLGQRRYAFSVLHHSSTSDGVSGGTNSSSLT